MLSPMQATFGARTKISAGFTGDAVMRDVPGVVSLLSGSRLKRVLGRTVALCLRFVTAAPEIDG